MSLGFDLLEAQGKTVRLKFKDKSPVVEGRLNYAGPCPGANYSFVAIDTKDGLKSFRMEKIENFEILKE